MFKDIFKDVYKFWILFSYQLSITNRELSVIY